MTRRTERKEESLHRILDAGAARLRREGLAGMAIADVMRDAGLTHGAFYVHFASKTELAVGALRRALRENRRRWVGGLRRESWMQRLHRLAGRYLSRAHRDDPGNGCALAALATETARAEPGFRRAYEEELHKSLQGICCGCRAEGKAGRAQLDEATALLALCVGGIALARAVTDEELSDRVLRACVSAAARIAAPAPDT